MLCRRCMTFEVRLLLLVLLLQLLRLLRVALFHLLLLLVVHLLLRGPRVFRFLFLR